MQQTDSSLHQDSFQGWQILGELELIVGIDSGEISTWLITILSALKLHADFAARVLKSAQDAVAHLMQSESVAKSKHIHLIILILQNNKSDKHNWGFFRIEKVGNESNQATPEHTLEFYLYQETH